MKRKWIGLLLSMCLALVLSIPVFAEEEQKDANIPEMVEVDPAVQNSIDAFQALQNAIAAKDKAAFVTAAEDFTAANEALTDEQQEELLQSITEDAFWEVVAESVMVGTLMDTYDAYLAAPNAKTALEFVEAYSELGTDSGSWLGEDGITEYGEATALLPSQDVITVTEAYEQLAAALLWGIDEDFFLAMDAFEAAIPLLEAMESNPEELKDLADMTGASDGPTAAGQMMYDWFMANVANDLYTVLNAFVENPVVDTAKPFVEYYEKIFNSTEYVDEAGHELLRELFWGIEDTYLEAKGMLPSAPIVIPDRKPNTPPTGDALYMYPLAGIMLAAFAVCVVIKKKENA